MVNLESWFKQRGVRADSIAVESALHQGADVSLCFVLTMMVMIGYRIPSVSFD